MSDYSDKARRELFPIGGFNDQRRTDAIHIHARTLEALDTERAAHEATKEAIKRQAAAVRTLQTCEQSEINILRKERHKAHEAIKTLESERAANALLTDELEATKAELQALREALEQIVSAKVAFNAHPVGVIATMQEWATQALTRKEA
jgi:chromosome segregation ATPase